MDSSTAVPIVRYGVENKKIPGGPTGWKMKDCGNICHWTGRDRYRLRDVSYAVKGSYSQARRAQELEKRSEEKMTGAEPVMGCGVENFLMDRRMHRGEAPPVPMHRATEDNLEENENRGKWYKTMRVEFCRRFWERERDQGAAVDGEIYERVSKDIVIILDKDSNVLLCKGKRLFQFLFGEKGKNKFDDAIRKWSSLPPFPVPETARHMVDDLIRPQHPELDLKKAQSLEELEQRYQCAVHYGTWAMQGRTNPDLVFRTVDTIFGRGRPRRVQEDIPGKLFPEFRKAAGLGSEVVRYLFQAVAPAEHRECCDVFQKHRVTGGNICFLPLAMALDYQPGDYVIFRGAEMGHFVADWTLYRIFLLYTYHQPVRNYAHRTMAVVPEPETLYETDIQGPAYISSDLLRPEFKKRQTEN
ncbi:hypothetical protein DL768_002341 [Monosporascus sp. mg162]|nr:hypothetical protein DL768_002341 [Monosporascus sp. mg162]